MSRSGYSDDCESWEGSFALWRQSVKLAINGKRGQAFLRDLLVSLQALPDKKLIAGNMERDGEVCAIGALGRMRGIDMTEIDQVIEEFGDIDGGAQVGYEVGVVFKIAPALAMELMYENDEASPWHETPEQRYHRMVRWVGRHIRGDWA